MTLVHQHRDRSHDLSLIGLIVVIVGIIAFSVPCVKIAIDQAFSLVQ